MTRARHYCAIGLIGAMTSLIGCGVKGVYSVTESSGGAGMQLVKTSGSAGPLRIVIEKPEISSNLSSDQASFWAERVRTRIESRFRESARSAGCRIVIVSPPEDLSMILDRIDRSTAGLGGENSVSTAPNVDWNVCIRGRVNLFIEEHRVPRKAWDPELPRSFGIVDVVSSTCNRNRVYVAHRTVSADVTMQLVTTRGTRPISFTPDEVGVVESEENPGAAFNRVHPLPPLNTDVERALEKVTESFVSVFFPQTEREYVEIKSSGDKLSIEGVKRLLAARTTDERKVAVEALEDACAAAPSCHKTVFALAIGLESVQEYERALDCCNRAIMLRGDKRNSTKSDDAAKVRKDPYYTTERRLHRSIEFQRVVKSLREEKQEGLNRAVDGPVNLTQFNPRTN